MKVCCNVVATPTNSSSIGPSQRAVWFSVSLTNQLKNTRTMLVDGRDRMHRMAREAHRRRHGTLRAATSTTPAPAAAPPC